MMADKEIVDRALLARIKELESHNKKLQKAREAFVSFGTIRIDPRNAGLKSIFSDKNAMYDKGDEDAPFFSEAYLYTLLGKDSARTLLARFRALGRALDIIENDLP
jgi:hypothetical protein